MALPARVRRILFWGITVVGVVLVIELVSALTYLALAGRWFSFTEIRTLQTTAAGTDSQAARVRQDQLPRFAMETLHPYLGFLLDPGVGSPVGEYGFATKTPFLQKRGPDRLVVGLFGGSFALGVGQNAGDALVAEIQRSQRAQGKGVRLVSTAVGGFKQPQQFLALAMMLALGGEIDVAITLDGFNDIVLPVVENHRHGVALFYPRGWAERTIDLQEGPALAMVGRIVEAEREQRNAARAISVSPARFLVTPNVVWYLVHRRTSASLLELRRELRYSATRSEHYFRTGPPSPEETEDEAMRRAAELWHRGSVEMDRLARANGATYVHFLQPNQYVEGSKPLTEQERRVAINSDPEAYGRIARKGYPLLVETGRRLTADGVAFHDLTRIFAEETQTLYVDECCHVNRTGYEKVARRMGEIVRAALDAAPR